MGSKAKIFGQKHSLAVTVVKLNSIHHKLKSRKPVPGDLRKIDVNFLALRA